ncbi:MAG: phosphoglucomutase [Epulopiscium sp.]|jgi:phosphoglucomutase|uniref:Phosphoglucomutase n=1 Tax=Defluviitalea raffinosedens TaxID=1450156 RepID=A0A7C8LFT9_9FIRM|nr:phospho-sugar mutase [Defluviitalea raffinosedens]KAE9636072.1 phospho-sugar mutase [Defluviitalea raffinosedens]MBZ4667777.1 phosphoglucomutase [Defluviitaleaceae bacterium]MDK2787811.1 phosphoglucomutase [Candidatus Epulonipiscium sp.]
MDFMEKYNQWLEDDYFDEETKKELKDISGDEKEIQERFYKELEFGTGGLRGIIGAGTNRMNKYSVRKATQGLANYILLENAEKNKEKGVVIAYDSRRYSREFAFEAAMVLNGNGIKTYVFEELTPTPELSFAVRYLGCVAGIVITASHNPKEYNGYKVYGSDGAQVPPPYDSEIIAEVNKITDFRQVKLMETEKAKEAGLLKIIGEEVNDAYIKEVKAQSINGDIIKKMADDFTIVYTPLHGTGHKPVMRVLKEVGFKNVIIVPEQQNPDPEFSTVSYPNPEDPAAFGLAIKLAKEHNADIIIGTDPDADRVGVLVRDAKGEYVVLTGNMTGVLLAEYLLSAKKAKGTLPKNGVLIKTIVTTEMARAIAKEYDITLLEVLTGFKFIGEKIKEFEQTGEHEYLFGFEESYGYLAGTYARDKDAVVASMLACELAAVYKDKGMTLYEGLQALYEKYGYYKEALESITLKGIEGLEKIQSIMTFLRNDPPKAVAGLKVLELRDYEKQMAKNLITNQEAKIHLPKSNVLYFVLENNAWFCIRPSGTEPKVKMYFGVKGKDEEHAKELLANLIEDVMGKINQI